MLRIRKAPAKLHHGRHIADDPFQPLGIVEVIAVCVEADADIAAPIEHDRTRLQQLSEPEQHGIVVGGQEAAGVRDAIGRARVVEADGPILRDRGDGFAEVAVDALEQSALSGGVFEIPPVDGRQRDAQQRRLCGANSG